jgi:3-hydroxybutyryl-CoA dehydrogenase
MRTDKIAVLGAGLMGIGIATRFANAGHRTLLYDLASDRLIGVPAAVCAILDELTEAGQFESAKIREVLGQIETTSDLQALGDVDLAIEAVPERIEVKRDLYASLLPILRGDTIITSNTSSFLPDALCEKFAPEDRARFLVTHFWNPPHFIPLVELVPGSATRPEIVESVRRIIGEIGGEPVVLSKAIPGFVGNRLQFAVLREALNIVQSGAASPEVVDTVIKMSLGRRYSMIGPFEGADIGGLNTFLDIAIHLIPELGTSQEMLDVLRDHIGRGETGERSGQGFYTWNTDRKLLLRAKRVHQMRTRFKE